MDRHLQYVKCGTVKSLDRLERICKEIKRDGFEVEELNTLVEANKNRVQFTYVIVFTK